VKFTPDGGSVALVVDTWPDGPGAEYARLVVSDTGFGIPEQDLHQIFRRFFRSSDATERAVQGTGLGLAIVQAIVEGHGGTVDVVSTQGEGSQFTVLLPLATVSAERAHTHE
jgi:signal transduction histidine kinase